MNSRLSTYGYRLVIFLDILWAWLAKQDNPFVCQLAKELYPFALPGKRKTQDISRPTLSLIVVLLEIADYLSSIKLNDFMHEISFQIWNPISKIKTFKYILVIIPDDGEFAAFTGTV